MKDPFGNYVIQYVCEKGSSEEIYQLALATLGKLVDLICQKYSSNVIERLFAIGEEGVRMAMIREIIETPRFPTLIHHNVCNE